MVSDSLWTRFAAASAASIPHKRSSAPTARSRPTTSTSPTRSSASSRTTRASARHQQPPDGRFEAHLDAQSQSTIVSAVLPPFPTSHKVDTVAQAIPIKSGLDYLSDTIFRQHLQSTSAPFPTSTAPPSSPISELPALPSCPTCDKNNTVAQATPIKSGLDHLSDTIFRRHLPSTSAPFADIYIHLPRYPLARPRHPAVHTAMPSPPQARPPTPAAFPSPYPCATRLRHPSRASYPSMVPTRWY